MKYCQVMSISILRIFKINMANPHGRVQLLPSGSSQLLLAVCGAACPPPPHHHLPRCLLEMSRGTRKELSERHIWSTPRSSSRVT